jgi:hypothetical protein
MVSIAMGLSGGVGLLTRYREDQFISNLVQTLEFLHTESHSSQQYYQIEFDLIEKSWRVGVLQPDMALLNSNTNEAIGVGSLTLELSEFLTPPLGNGQSFIPPPTFPSLAQPHIMPGTGKIVDIHTPRGEITPESGMKPYIIFSPGGFTEFAVIHILRSAEQHTTLVTNPFTGAIETHSGYKEFKWNYDSPDGL